jgi:hypothetical protein
LGLTSLEGLEEGRIFEIFNEALDGVIQLANAVLHCDLQTQIPQTIEGGEPMLSSKLEGISYIIAIFLANCTIHSRHCGSTRTAGLSTSLSTRSGRLRTSLSIRSGNLRRTNAGLSTCGSTRTESIRTSLSICTRRFLIDVQTIAWVAARIALALCLAAAALA